ncbi:MAG: hypothetical protein SFV81_21020 [Pirellulaceae bacterium]|nr:hypothetical protein [Pirellulaceae bacterium]
MAESRDFQDNLPEFSFNPTWSQRTVGQHIGWNDWLWKVMLLACGNERDASGVFQ